MEFVDRNVLSWVLTTDSRIFARQGNFDIGL